MAKPPETDTPSTRCGAMSLETESDAYASSSSSSWLSCEAASLSASDVASKPGVCADDETDEDEEAVEWERLSAWEGDGGGVLVGDSPAGLM